MAIVAAWIFSARTIRKDQARSIWGIEKMARPAFRGAVSWRTCFLATEPTASWSATKI